MPNKVDIQENEILQYDSQIFSMLLIDRSKSKQEDKHIIWATDNYVQLDQGYGEWEEITVDAISGKNGLVLRPRVNKSKEEREHRFRDKAEVFTAFWICNKQNNLIGAAWFGVEKSPFNTELENGWETNSDTIVFPKGKTWQDYVKDTRLEMACGEAPYLVSRYDVVTSEELAINEKETKICK